MVAIDKIKQVVYSYTLNLESGHDYSHLLRVEATAKEIMQGMNVDEYYLTLLVFLHDIEDHKLNTNVLVKDILNELGIEKEIQEKVLNEVQYLSFSKYKTKNDLSLEAKIVSDADRIDALGAVGVARAFSYGGAHNRKLYGENSTLNHFKEKLLILDQYLYLDKSKAIAKPRMDFLKLYYDTFLKEIKKDNGA